MGQIIGEEREWVSPSTGKSYKTRDGYICLTCCYMQCSCGSPLWSKLCPISPIKPTFKPMKKPQIIEILERTRLFYLRKMSDSYNHSRFQAEVLLEVLGYDGVQSSGIINQWEDDYKAKLKAARL